jgi:tripartite-type tricarboxylate transporter receptor subunit TctC
MHSAPFLARLAACLLIIGSAHAHADGSWPAKPVKIVVPFAPGGGGDAVVRVLTEKLSKRLGQTVYIENRPGASGYIGAQAVATAAPDGYTLLMGFDGSMVVAPHLIKAPFDTLRDFAPITKLNDATLLVAVNPSLPVHSLKELVEVSKKQDGLDYGSSGAGTTTHLAGVMLGMRSGAVLRHVPYKGGGQAVTDVAGGQIPMIYTVIPTVIAFVKDKRLRPIAVSSAKRSTVLPDVPTMAESGLPGFEVSSWYGLLAPTKTPVAIIERLQREVAAVLAEPDIRENYRQGGFEPVGNKPAEFAAQIKADSERWGKVVKDAGIRID